MSGKGRGGRGALLLQALNAPPKRPGDQVDVPNVPLVVSQDARSYGSTQAQASPIPAATGGEQKPRGRASILRESLRAIQPLSPVGSAVSSQSGQQRGLLPHPDSRSSTAHHSRLGGAGEPLAEAERQSICSERPDDRFSLSLDRKISELTIGPPLPRGISGTPIPLAVNYIPVSCRNEGLYEYAVSFSPRIDSLSERHKLFYSLSNKLGRQKIFDGAVLGLPMLLPDKETVFTACRDAGERVEVKLKFVKIVPHEACTPFYARALRTAMKKLNMTLIGRDHYLPQCAKTVPQHKLEVWPGFVTSLHVYEGGLMLLCEVSHRVLRAQTALEVMNDVHRAQRGNLQSLEENITRALLGATVLTRYNNKTYRIDDIDFKQTPENTFDRSGQPTSYVDYYRDAYNKDIQELKQPMLIHKPKKKDLIQSGRRNGTDLIYLVPELCNMTGLTDEMRSDFRVMKSLAEHTRISPEKRAQEMRKFVMALRDSPEAMEILDGWGLRLELDQARFEGRKLPIETIYFGRGKEASAGPEADWGRELDRMPAFHTKPMTSWVVLFIGRDEPVVQNFLQMMGRVCPNMGIEYKPPTRIRLDNDKTETYVGEIRRRMPDNTQIVTAIFPSSRDDRYNAIKKLCCSEKPMPSQVIISKTIRDERKLKSVTVKIALQMNVKLGGELWRVKIPMNGLMVCGIDTYHEGKGLATAKSVGGFVSSMNTECSRWFSRACFQAAGQEMIDCLMPCFLEALREYSRLNDSLPRSIVIFRDGVGDGQMRHVADYEIKQLVGAFSKFPDNYNPKFGFVVVQKRINTRIFLQHNRGQGLVNPPPGTVLDHGVTRTTQQDYFLVSQHVRQGTVTPTHYVSLGHDENNSWKVDHLQKLSYKLTHMYYNWPGTIRVPAPCQYAHKLAYQVGQNIRKDPHWKLSHVLFYM